MTVLGICRRPRASAGWVRGPSMKPSSTRSAYLVPTAEFATPGLGVLVIDDPECLKVKVKVSGFREDIYLFGQNAGPAPRSCWGSRAMNAEERQECGNGH